MKIGKYRIEMFWAWYDAWIGAYWNKDRRVLYICPLIFIVIAIHFPPKKTAKCYHLNTSVYHDGAILCEDCNCIIAQGGKRFDEPEPLI